MKIPFLGCLILCACLAGCIIDTSSRNEHTGRVIGAETLGQIQPGQSTEFVRALLGEPTTCSTAGGKTEVWKYEYTKREHKHSSLIFVLDTDNSNDVRRTTYVLFEDAKVAKVWQD
jgi:outer membrane protein assembly factor BamE (lipoprotein component of BamABCDE complex)